MYQMKAHVMPPLYFHGLVKGWWEGPAIVRKAFRSAPIQMNLFDII
jgi:hypothetical protein